MASLSSREKLGAQTMRERLEIADRFTQLSDWRMEEIKPFLKQSKVILDAGAGVGNYTSYLVKTGKKVIGADYDIEFVNKLEKRFKDQLNFRAIQLDLTNKQAVLALRDQNVDVIVCLDVLEHIKKDELAITNLTDLLPRGGRLIVLVPGHPLLYCLIDHFVGHIRRYTRREIENKLSKHLKIIKGFGFNSFGILGYFITGKIMRKKYYYTEGQQLFDRIVPFFKWFDRNLLRRSVGLSHIVICEK